MGKSIYFDTEFSEGFVKPISWLPSWFPYNKPKWTIELISIGMVKEDGEEYYAISDEFSVRNCNDWVKKNVLTLLPEKFTAIDRLFEELPTSSPLIIKNPIYRSLKEIKRDVVWFCEENPIFYAYFADYDWVVVCSNLFGRMIDLPGSWPFYCKDLKQILDEKAAIFCEKEIKSNSFKAALDRLKNWTEYPKQADEHNALSDAKFNRDLHKFINTHLKPWTPGRVVK